MNPLQSLLGFLERLTVAQISYVLRHSRYDAIMVENCVPGERWEVEFLETGEVEVERFVSGGIISGAEALEDLFSRFSEPQQNR
jgi:hypothetical protein